MSKNNREIMIAGFTSDLSEVVEDIAYQTLPKSAVESAIYLYLDYIAAAHVGYHVNIDFNAVIKDVLLQNAGIGNSSVFFQRQKTNALIASFLNAAYAHGADMDDGNKLAAGHPGAPVISAVIALAEERECTNGAVIEALVAGYEVFCRLAAGCMPDMVSKGFHSTGTAGTIAAAAASAKLLGLDAAGIYHSIAISVSQSSGLLVVGQTGQEIKPINPAKAAQSGVFSALLAERGVIGPEKPLEQEKGWLGAMADSFDKDLLAQGVSEGFLIETCYTKAYPSCRHTHACIDAASALRKRTGCRTIKRVDVFTYGHAIELAGQISVPKTSAEAKFSIAYAIATMLARGAFGFAELDVESLDEDAMRLIDVIDIHLDDSYEKPKDGIRGASVKLTFTDESVDEEIVLQPKGEPDNPFSNDELAAKYASCCRGSDGHDVSSSDIAEFIHAQVSAMNDTEATYHFPRQKDWESL